MSFLSNVAGSYDSRVKKGLQEAGMGILSALRGRLSSFGLSMPIGSLGPIIFEVSSSKARTFKDMKRNTKGRYGSHEIIGGKPVIEFMGPDGEELSFTMQFSVAWGLNPQEEIQKIRELCEKGEVNYLVLCNTPIGENPWAVDSVSESVDIVDNNGRIIASQIDITLREYVPNIS